MTPAISTTAPTRAERTPLPGAHLVALLIAGPAIAAAATVGRGGWPAVEQHPTRAALLAVLAFITDLYPAQFFPRSTIASIPASAAFCAALLLGYGAGPAIGACLVAGTLAGFVHRQRAERLLREASSNVLTLAAGAAVLVLVHRTAPMADGRVTPAQLPAVGLAWLALIAATAALAPVNGRALSPAERTPSTDRVTDAVTAFVTLGIAPLVVVVVWADALLAPLLLLPIGALYLTARASTARAREASHDALTGLPNRAHFHRRFAKALADAERRGTKLAVLLIDLDRFKDINDTLGHHIGDQLLRRVGPRIEEVERTMMVARLGGDEFAVLLAPTGSGDEALAMAREVVKAVQMPFEVADLELDVDASIGVACYPDHGHDAETLLQRADVAMYVAKSSRTGAELYDDSRNVNTRRRFQLMRQLRTGIGDKEFDFSYQPKVELATGAVCGVEALARWNHPELGVIAPNEFISIAEHTGGIHTLTQYLLRLGLEQSRDWRRHGIDLRIAVNLSPTFLQDLHLPTHIGRLLTLLDVPSSRLELEITETTLMADPDGAARVLGELADMGVRLLIDDFGTGYSSLAYLRNLPVSEIKIDKSFIPTPEQPDETIVRAIVDLAHNLGLEVTAEGIETDEQLELLTGLGCTYGQGFLLGRPMAAKDLRTHLRTSALERQAAI
jgi:diguanylate cyclase (GGDEF)-like protein